MIIGRFPQENDIIYENMSSVVCKDNLYLILVSYELIEFENHIYRGAMMIEILKQTQDSFKLIYDRKLNNSFELPSFEYCANPYVFLDNSIYFLAIDESK